MLISRFRALTRELDMRIQGTQIDKQMMKLVVEATKQSSKCNWWKSMPEWGMEVVGT
jgi:hypothetical protein